MGALDPEAVRERWLEVSVPDAIQPLAAECRAAVAERIPVPLELMTDWPPEPVWLHPRPGTPDRSAIVKRTTTLAVNADGRTVVVEHMRRGRKIAEDYVVWSGDRVELVEDRPRRQLSVFALDGGRAVEMMSTYGMKRSDGRPALSVERYEFDAAGRVEYALGARESGSDSSSGPRGAGWRGSVMRYSYADDGRLLLAQRFAAVGELAPGGDHEAALEAVRASYDRGEVEQVRVWDARESALEDEVPHPEHAYDGLAAPLADAVVAALEDARRDLGPVAFAVVQLRPDLSAAFASVAYRNRARARVEPSEVIDLALEGRAGTVTVARSETLRAATPEAQRMWRAGTQVLDLGVPDWQAPAIIDLAAGLARELNARVWRDVEPEFVAVVTDGERDQGYPEAMGRRSSIIFDAEQAGQLYNGQYTDSETGLQYLRDRYYDPSTAQFLTPDALQAVTGQPYSYADDDPTNLVDPTGLLFWIPGTPSFSLPSWSQVGTRIVGFVDGFTRPAFGGTAALRSDLGLNGGLDTCSADYQQASDIGQIDEGAEALAVSVYTGVKAAAFLRDLYTGILYEGVKIAPIVAPIGGGIAGQAADTILTGGSLSRSTVPKGAGAGLAGELATGLVDGPDAPGAATVVSTVVGLFGG